MGELAYSQSWFGALFYRLILLLDLLCFWTV